MARFRNALITLCCVVMVACSAGPGRPQPSRPVTATATAPTPRHDPRVVQIVQAALGHDGTGLSFAVQVNGRTVAAGGAGWADIAGRIRASADTVYPIASVTKQFTAAGIMQLVEQGKVRLDETVPELVPGLRWRDPRIARVTVRQLLTHTSGIPGYTGQPGFRTLDARPQTQRTILSLVTGQPLRFAPGTRAAYSNTGYYLLGMGIEHATGITYRRYLHDRLLAGLGMTHTALCPDTQDGTSVARLYAEGGSRPRLAPHVSLVNAFAAGQICSTVPDLLRWQTALRAGRVVSAASYRQMVTPLRLADGKTIAYGFGLDLDPINHRPAVDHEGGFPGDAADLVWYPDDDLAIATLDNSSTVAAWDLSARIARLYLH